MSEFSKTFLRDRLGDGKQPREFFGMFGKHPGWDDHIEDLPLPTPSMAAAKQLLYVQGIGSQISSGAWARLADEALLPGFDHAFLWVRGSQFLAGRMWASSDGKRRTHFPMIALVHAVSVDLDAALESILAQLENVAAGCRAGSSADEVREVVRGAWSAERGASEERGATDAPRYTLYAPRSPTLQIVRCFHETLSPHTRVPADPRDPTGSLRFWSRVCPALVPAETPLLFLAPLGEAWVDVLASEPAPLQFFCLRARPCALPIAGGETPDEVAEAIDADELIKAALGGEAPAAERSWFTRLLRH